MIILRDLFFLFFCVFQFMATGGVVPSVPEECPSSSVDRVIFDAKFVLWYLRSRWGLLALVCKSWRERLLCLNCPLVVHSDVAFESPALMTLVMSNVVDPRRLRYLIIPLKIARSPQPVEIYRAAFSLLDRTSPGVEEHHKFLAKVTSDLCDLALGDSCFLSRFLELWDELLRKIPLLDSEHHKRFHLRQPHYHSSRVDDVTFDHLWRCRWFRVSNVPQMIRGLRDDPDPLITLASFPPGQLTAEDFVEVDVTTILVGSGHLDVLKTRPLCSTNDSLALLGFVQSAVSHLPEEEVFPMLEWLKNAYPACLDLRLAKRILWCACELTQKDQKKTGLSDRIIAWLENFWGLGDQLYRRDKLFCLVHLFPDHPFTLKLLRARRDDPPPGFFAKLWGSISVSEYRALAEKVFSSHDHHRFGLEEDTPSFLIDRWLSDGFPSPLLIEWLEWTLEVLDQDALSPEDSDNLFDIIHPCQGSVDWIVLWWMKNHDSLPDWIYSFEWMERPTNDSILDVDCWACFEFVRDVYDQAGWLPDCVIDQFSDTSIPEALQWMWCHLENANPLDSDDEEYDSDYDRLFDFPLVDALQNIISNWSAEDAISMLDWFEKKLIFEDDPESLDFLSVATQRGLILEGELEKLSKLLPAPKVANWFRERNLDLFSGHKRRKLE